MDPFTHLMTGACLARAGFNRKAAYATAAMVVAADLPDIDTLWSLGGPVAAFQHHRGWTHTFLGMPVEAAVVVGVAWLWHRWLGDKEDAKLAAPVKWGLLFWFAIVALLSHVALDWTNDYGVRPFFPFNPHWYSGSIVFIVEPVLWAMLLAALVAPALFGLIGSEVGARKEQFRGRGWAIAALVGMIALWGWREVERQRALQLVEDEDFGGVEVRRMAVSPHPITPFKWHAVVETPMYYQTAVVDTLSGTVTASAADMIYKPPTTLATLLAKRSWLGEVYLDWSEYPVVEEAAPGSDPEDNTLTTVTFRDLRFTYDVPFLDGRKKPPLEGIVTINDDRRVVGMEMDGRMQR